MPQIKKSNLPEKTCIVCQRPHDNTPMVYEFDAGDAVIADLINGEGNGN